MVVRRAKSRGGARARMLRHFPARRTKKRRLSSGFFKTENSRTDHGLIGESAGTRGTATLTRPELHRKRQDRILSARNRFPSRTRHIPGATYRLQFNHKFTFNDGSRLVSYLKSLGITDCYASPIFAARNQSDHGYDVCNFERISPQLGGGGAFDRFAQKLARAGISLLLDMVPNHMATDCSNGWWLDVLENGQASKYADWFDIDWDSDDPALKGKVLLPVLGDHAAKVVRSGNLRLAAQDNQFRIAYYDRTYPIRPEARRALMQQVSQNGMHRVLQKYNDSTASPHPLEELLEQQHYRLAFWREASEKLNYRRFFDVTDLICLRMELPPAFEAAHKLLFSLIKNGKVSGLRVDHPDGLWNPKQYFTRLQDATKPHFYIVAEKILTRDERLPENWPIDGTTGYDFLNRLNGIFIDSRSEKAFDALYANFTAESQDFAHSVRAGKRTILTTSLKPELNR